MSATPEHTIVVSPTSIVHSITGRDFGRCSVCWRSVTRNESYEDVRRDGRAQETPWRHQRPS